MHTSVYYVAGEPSGDQLAFWHSNRFFPHADLYGVAGDYMQQKMQLDLHLKELSYLVSFQLLLDLPKLYSIQKTILNSIKHIKPTHVILVNFSSFNLSLAKKIKYQNPYQKITFFSPPQLWIWGAWRIKKIKKYIDTVEVIFPFEVEWYKKQHIHATYVGSPTFDRYKKHTVLSKQPLTLLCLPGSRSTELQNTLDLFIASARLLQNKYSTLKIIIPVAQVILKQRIEETCKKYQLENYYLSKENDLFTLLKKLPTIALSKPGTNTLELALAGVPTLVAYKMAWPLYWIARFLVKTNHTALPNILLNQEMFPEIIQYNCSPETIAYKLDQLLCQKNNTFLQQKKDLLAYFE